MPLVTIVILTPAVFATFIGSLHLLLKKLGSRSEEWVIPVGLIGSLMTFLFSLSIVLIFNPDMYVLQFLETSEWIPALHATYTVGLDGLSLWFFVLTAFLTPLALLVALREIDHNRTAFVVNFLYLETALLGVFASQDVFLFYVFWELSLIPMVFIIYLWGGADRIRAVWKFVLYTLAGSFLMLIALLYIVIELNPENLQFSTLRELLSSQTGLDFGVKALLFAGFTLAFLIKLPALPFHNWLPSAHVEAPTPGSVMLAGILLKMGGYGLVRFSIAWFPDVARSFSTPFMVLGIAGIIYASFMAYAQEDMKKVIAYSSIGHLGLALAGVFAFEKQALLGALFLMISHGLTSAGMFSLIGVVYHRTHHRLRSQFGGLFSKTPWYGTVFLIVTFGAVGLPLTGGFVGEFLTIWGLVRVSPIWGLLGASGAILSAIYMLSLVRDVFHGKERLPENIRTLEDLVFTEKVLFLIYIGCIVLLGIVPGIIIHSMSTYISGLFEVIRPYLSIF